MGTAGKQSLCSIPVLTCDLPVALPGASQRVVSVARGCSGAVSLCAQPRVKSAPADGSTASAEAVAACAGLGRRWGSPVPRPPAPRLHPAAPATFSAARGTSVVFRGDGVFLVCSHSPLSGGNLLWLPSASRAEWASRPDQVCRCPGYGDSSHPASPCSSSPAPHVDYPIDSSHNASRDIAPIAPSCR